MAMIYRLDYVGASSVAGWARGSRNVDASSLQGTSVCRNRGGRADGGLADTSLVEGVQITSMVTAGRGPALGSSWGCGGHGTWGGGRGSNFPSLHFFYMYVPYSHPPGCSVC